MPFPNAPSPLSYGAPQVDFSPIGQLGNDYFQGAEQRRKYDLARAFPNGIPRKPDGTPDFSAFADVQAQHGEYGQAIPLETQALDRQQLANAQGSSPMGGPATPTGAPPSAPTASPISKPAAGFTDFRSATPGPTAGPQNEGALEQGAAKGATLRTLAAGIAKNADVSDIIKNFAAAKKIDPDDPLTPDQEKAIRPVLAKSIAARTAQAPQGSPMAPAAPPQGQQPTPAAPPPSSLLPPGVTDPQKYVADQRAIGNNLLRTAGEHGKALAAQAFARADKVEETLVPKLQEVGTDPLTGDKKYAWVSPNSMTMTPATTSPTGGTAAPGAASGQEMVDRIIAKRDAGADRKTLLQEVPSTYRDYVNSMLEGKAIPANLGRPGPARAAAITLAHAVDPNFDETQIVERQTFARGMGQTTPSSYGGQLQASGTVAKHLGDAYDALGVMEKGALGTSDVAPALNPLKTAIRGQINDKEFLDARGHFDIAKKGIAGELEKLLSGSHGAESSKQYWMDKLDFNRGPTAIKAALDEVRSLMMGRVSNVAQAKDRAYGGETDPLTLFGPKEKAIMTKIAGNTYAGKGGEAGTTAAAPAPGTAMIVNPKTGEKMVLSPDGTKWVPAP